MTALNDIAGGYEPVPIAYGQIRKSRRRELYIVIPRLKMKHPPERNPEHAQRKRYQQLMDMSLKSPQWELHLRVRHLSLEDLPRQWHLQRSRNDVTTEPQSSDEAAAKVGTISNDDQSVAETALSGQEETSFNRLDVLPGEGAQSSVTVEESSSNVTRTLPPSEIQTTDPASTQTPPKDIPSPSPTANIMPPPLFAATSQMPMQGNPNPFLTPSQIPPQPFHIQEQRLGGRDPNLAPNPTQLLAQNTQTTYTAPTQTPPQNLSAAFYPPIQPQSLGFPSQFLDAFHIPSTGFPMPFQSTFQALPSQSIHMHPYSFQNPQCPTHHQPYPTQPNAQAPFHQQHQTPQSFYGPMAPSAAFQMSSADAQMPPAACRQPLSTFSRTAKSNILFPSEPASERGVEESTG
ncbi:MAG: hypothetical protein L6R37_008084 [Teloschistes peruensis]|nr:MAG: hypothetical protein L6R37_008084 [Teloschistes peruensis]